MTTTENENEAEDSPLFRHSTSPPAVSFMLRPSRGNNSEAKFHSEQTPSSMARTSSLTQSDFGCTGNTPATVVRPRAGRVSNGAERNMFSHRPSSIHGDALESSLTAVAAKTIEDLEYVWDEVGCEQEERESQLKELTSSIQALCDEKIEFERNVADKYRESIKSLRAEMSEICTALQFQMADPTLASNSLNLVEELQTLESTLEDLRDEASEASAELCSLRDEILHLYTALEGNPPVGENYWWMDTTSNLTKERREKFRHYMMEMNEQVEQRSHGVVKIILSCRTLLTELAVSNSTNHVEAIEDDTKDSSISNIYMSELDEKIMHSLKAVSATHSHDGSRDPPQPEGKASSYKIHSIMETSTCTGISASAFEKLKDRFEELTTEKYKRKQRLAVLGGHIANLWEKLKIPELEQKEFIKKVQGALSVDVIRKGEQELQRLNELMDVMIVKLVAEARNQILLLWDETNAGTQQKKSFPLMFITDETKFTDDLLLRHEEYINELRNRLETMQPILNTIAKREEILKERMDLEEFQKDPSRLQGRTAAKQLQKEEKMAKRIKKDLPKITQSLEKDCLKWKAEHGEEFLFHGEIYLDVIEKEEEEWLDHRHGAAREKKLNKQKIRRDVGIENTKSRGSSFAPLPGAKKDFAESLQRRTGSTNPLGNATNRPNPGTVRHPSRGKARPASRPKTRPISRAR